MPIRRVAKKPGQRRGAVEAGTGRRAKAGAVEAGTGRRAKTGAVKARSSVAKGAYEAFKLAREKSPGVARPLAEKPERAPAARMKSVKLKPRSVASIASKLREQTKARKRKPKRLKAEMKSVVGKEGKRRAVAALGAMARGPRAKKK